MPHKATEKTLLEIQEGEWGITLVQGYINKDGEFKVEFCKKKNYQSQEFSDMRPLSVYVGKTKDKAIALARYILETFGEHMPEAGNFINNDRMRDPETDDIPF